MVEVGQLEIAGSLDTSDIENGFVRITGSFKQIENQSKQTNASLSSTKSIAKSLGKTLIGIGVTGVGAMTALASKSPVLAGTMSKIQVSTMKLSNTLGRQMRPAFEGMNELINGFNSAASNSDSVIGGLSNTIGNFFSDTGKALSGQEIQFGTEKALGTTAGTVSFGGIGGLLGFLLGGPSGAVAGFGAGASIGGPLGHRAGEAFGEYNRDVLSEVRQPGYQPLSEKAKDIDDLKDPVSRAGLFFMDMMNAVLAGFGDKNVKMSNADGVTR